MAGKRKTFWESFPHQQKLFEARKNPDESLAQWAARLNKLGNETGYVPGVLDKLLREKFVSGLDPGPIKEYFEARGDLHQFTYKQTLVIAFTKAAQLDKEARAASNQNPR